MALNCMHGQDPVAAANPIEILLGLLKERSAVLVGVDEMLPQVRVPESYNRDLPFLRWPQGSLSPGPLE